MLQAERDYLTSILSGRLRVLSHVVIMCLLRVGEKLVKTIHKITFVPVFAKVENIRSSSYRRLFV